MPPLVDSCITVRQAVQLVKDLGVLNCSFSFAQLLRLSSQCVASQKESSNTDAESLLGVILPKAEDASNWVRSNKEFVTDVLNCEVCYG